MCPHDRRHRHDHRTAASTPRPDAEQHRTSPPGRPLAAADAARAHRGEPGALPSRGRSHARRRPPAERTGNPSRTRLRDTAPQAYERHPQAHDSATFALATALAAACGVDRGVPSTGTAGRPHPHLTAVRSRSGSTGISARWPGDRRSPLRRGGFRTVSTQCAPRGTRTPNLLIRSQMLYPIELRALLGWRQHGLKMCAAAQWAKACVGNRGGGTGPR